MSLYIIARLSSKGEKIGYRIYNTESERYADWQTSRVLTTLQHNGIKLINAELDAHGDLKGTAGDLKKYPEIDIETDSLIGQNAYTIIGKNTETGVYHTVDSYGIPRELSEVNLIRGLSSRGLTNASLVQGKGKSYIRGKKSFEELGSTYKYLQKDYKTPNNFDLVKSWRVRIIKPGEPYGRDGCLTNEGKPLVEFISLDTNQFVSRYFVETLLEHSDTNGLNLHGGVHAWTIEGVYFKKILDWLRSLKL